MLRRVSMCVVRMAKQAAAISVRLCLAAGFLMANWMQDQVVGMYITALLLLWCIGMSIRFHRQLEQLEKTQKRCAKVIEASQRFQSTFGGD